MKKFSIVFGSFLILCIVGCYLLVIYGIPKFVNSQRFEPLLESIVAKKFNLNIDIKNLSLEITPLLKSNIEIEKLTLINKNNKVALDLSDFKADITRTYLNSLEASYINIDIDELMKIISTNRNKKTDIKKFQCKSIPDLKIKKIQISKNNGTFCSLFACRHCDRSDWHTQH